MNCPQCQEELAAYVDGLLDPSAASRLEAHLADCPACRAELDEVQQLVERLVLGGRAFSRVSLDAQVMDQIVQEQAFHFRRIKMKRMAQIAAAAVVIVGLGLGISYLTKGHDGGIALAEVVKEMQQIKTATWTEVQQDFPPKEPLPPGVMPFDGADSVTRRWFYKAPGYVRTETTQRFGDKELKHVTIIDLIAGYSVMLDPQEMTAALYPLDQPAGKHWIVDWIFNWFVEPEEAIPPDATPLGEKTVGNRKAIGFGIEFKGDGTDVWAGKITDIWVDVETKRIVLVETGDPGEFKFVLKDFVFDRELKDSLFSLVPPKGYRLLEKSPPIYGLIPPEKEGDPFIIQVQTEEGTRILGMDESTDEPGSRDQE